MLIIRLAGGFGNQLFQLGTGLLLASKNNFFKIIIDDSALSTYDIKRINELTNFFDFTKFHSNISFKNNFLTKLRIPKIMQFTLNKFPFIGDNNFQKILNNPNNLFTLMDGYFQWVLTQKDFNEILTILQKGFNSSLIQNQPNNHCVIHIRGGDFVKLGWNNITPKNYYIEAIKNMREKENIQKFIIVTDDKAYATSILKDIECFYTFKCVEIITDFYTIASYSKRILSSSTFSLWASALGNNKNSKVIAPEFWFPNKKREILLPNEMRI